MLGTRAAVGERSALRRIALLLALISVALLASAARATANDLFTLDAQATSPGRVIEDSAGNAYVGWIHDAAIDQPMFCKIPPGGTCTNPISLPIPGATSTLDEVSGVFPVFGPEGTLFVVAPRYVRNDVVFWTSTDGGQSFDTGVERKKGYSNKTNPSTVLFVGANILTYQFLISADNAGLGFSRTFVLEAEGDNFTFASPGEGGVAGSSLGLDSGKPVEAYWNLSSPYQVLFYRASGAPEFESNWVGPTTVANGYESKLAGGAGGLFLVSQDYAGGENPTAVNVRKYNGTSFGPPVTLANDSSVSLFLGGAIAQSPGGRLAVAWPGTRAADGAHVMRLFTSTDGGASFGETDVAHIGNAYAIDDNAQLAVGDGGQGWLTFRDASGLRVADLNPIAGPSGPIPPTYKGPTKTITKSVDGFLLTLTVPKHCLQPRQPFFIGVGKRARHRVKKSVRGKLKILKVTFKFDGKKLSTKKKKPFRQLVSPGSLPSGSPHTVIARVTVRLTKHGHKKKVVRVLKGTITIC